MKRLLPLLLFSSMATAHELNFQGFIDNENDSNLNFTYRHQFNDVGFIGLIDNGPGLGFRIKSEMGEALAEVGYDFFHSGFVGSVNLFDNFSARREYVNDGVWLTSTALSGDIKINEAFTVVPSIRGGWYSDGNAMKGAKLSGVYAFNDDWIARSEISWRGWNEQVKEYYSPNTESRYSLVPMYRWSGMQVGIGPLYINEYDNSLGARLEFRMRNPAVRFVVDATNVYSSAYVYINWNF